MIVRWRPWKSAGGSSKTIWRDGAVVVWRWRWRSRSGAATVMVVWRSRYGGVGGGTEAVVRRCGGGGGVPRWWWSSWTRSFLHVRRDLSLASEKRPLRRTNTHRDESSNYDIMSLGRPSFSAARSYVFRGTIVRLLCQRPATYNDASQWSEISPAPSARGSARRTWGPRSRPSAGSCRAARSRRNRSASTPRRNTVGGGIAPNKIKQTHQR